MAPKQRLGGSKSPPSRRTPSPHSPNLARASTPPGSAGRFPNFPVPELTFRNTIRNASLERTAYGPEGFSYDGAVCYRNAVLIMLLTSDVFMKYVRDWHASRVKNRRQLAQTADNEPESDYTDVFIKLNELWGVYDADPKEAKLKSAMTKYWKYLCSPQVGDYPWPAGGQQDAEEFLIWILGTFRSQLGQDPYLASEADYLNQLIQVGHASRELCTKCGAKNPKKYRLSVDAREDRLLVHLSDGASNGPANSAGKQSSVKLTDLLEYSTRLASTGWLCDECYAKWRTAYTQIVDSKEKKAAEMVKESKPGRGWAYLRVLPEVLFMVLLRFKSSGSSSSKDETFVEVVEELDFAPILEKTMPEEERVNTRYRLQSVISHQGSLAQGHYRNHVRANDDVDVDWWLIDGTHTEEVDFGHINKEDRPRNRRNQAGDPWTPYVLCWERIIEDPTLPTGSPIQQPTSPTTGRQHSVSSGSKHGSNSNLAKDQRTVHFDEASAEPQGVAPQQSKAKSEELLSGSVQEEQKPRNSSAKGTPVDHQGPDPPTISSKIRAFVEIDGKRHVFHEIMLELPSDFVDKVRQKKGAKVDLGVQLHIPQGKGKHSVVYDLVTASNPPKGRKVGILDDDDCLSGSERVLIEARLTTPTDSLQKNNQPDSLGPLAIQETSPGSKRKLREVNHEAADQAQSEASPQKKARQGPGANRRSSASRSASPADAISNEDRIKALAHSNEALETKTPEGLEALKLRLQLEDRQSTFKTPTARTQVAATPQSAKARAKFNKNGKPRASTISPTFQPDADLTATFLKTLPRSKANQTERAKAKTAEPASFNATAEEDRPEPSTKTSTGRRRSSLPPNLRIAEPSPVLKRTRGQTARAQEEKQQQAASKAASTKSQQGHGTTATTSQPAPKPQAVPPTKTSSGSGAHQKASDSKKTPPPPAAPPSPRKGSSPYEEEWSPGKEAKIAAAVKAAKEKRIADKRAARRKQVEKEEAEAEEQGEHAKPKPRGRAAAKARLKTDGGKGRAAAKSTTKSATKAATTTKSTTTTKPAAKQAAKRKKGDVDDDGESESEYEDSQPVKKARTKATATAKTKPNAKASTTTTTTTKQQPKNQKRHGKKQAKTTKQEHDDDESEAESSSQSESERDAAEDADRDDDDEDAKNSRNTTKGQPPARAARGRGTQRQKLSKAHVARFFF